jgi:hypothetical protein
LTPKHHALHTDDIFSWPTHCPSCLANANGHYCATCGETLRPHLPSAGEFVHEFVGHYVALEGKLLTTLKLLLFRPGRLTVAFLNGRRLPTIAPLRLYLTLSLIMFAMIKWCGVGLPQVQLNNAFYGVSYSHIVANPDKPGKTGVATLFVKVAEDLEDTSGDATVHDQIRMALATLGAVNKTWMRNVQAFMAEPAEEQGRTLNHGFLANLPYMLIAALPLFALYLKLLYRGAGRVYGEHLVFALHTNAFAFLLASVMMALPGNVAWLVMAIVKHETRLISPWDCLQLLPLLWLLAYLPVAMQRVYGGTRLATGCKWLVLITVHLLVIAVLTILAEGIAIVGHA